MKKLRERLSNKKGFTLVELIVVIVIILILAAVLIPNVMRYIGSARESAFQSEASGYLTEITGYEAEHFAKYNQNIDVTKMLGATETVPTQANGTDAVYALTAFDTKVGSVANSDAKIANADTAKINVTVSQGAVKTFGYCDGTYYVNWTQEKGWDNVQEVAD